MTVVVVADQVAVVIVVLVVVVVADQVAVGVQSSVAG